MQYRWQMTDIPDQLKKHCTFSNAVLGRLVCWQGL